MSRLIVVIYIASIYITLAIMRTRPRIGDVIILTIATLTIPAIPVIMIWYAIGEVKIVIIPTFILSYIAVMVALYIKIIGGSIREGVILSVVQLLVLFVVTVILKVLLKY